MHSLDLCAYDLIDGYVTRTACQGIHELEMSSGRDGSTGLFDVYVCCCLCGQITVSVRCGGRCIGRTIVVQYIPAEKQMLQ